MPIQDASIVISLDALIEMEFSGVRRIAHFAHFPHCQTTSLKQR
jgi:hypothetical protein